MTPQERQGLHELQAELAGLVDRVWQPRCISAAFCSAAEEAPFVFRMQTWIDLDAIRSPVLEGRIPEEAVFPALKGALAAFGQREATVDDLEPEAVILLFEDMITAVRKGFSTALPMEPPRADGSLRGDDGFGNWLPIFACLVGQLHVSPGAALVMPVAKVLALVATHRWCQGWRVKGEPYAYREIENRED